MAMHRTLEVYKINGLAQRLKQLVRQLRKFNFPLLSQPVAALLTRSQNHSATKRFEALLHLAALKCRGSNKPTPPQMREWLNTMIFNDPITGIEDPVEDVFVSNVCGGFGNARLFEGNWSNNAQWVESCIVALSRIPDRKWVMELQRHVVAMLRVSEAIAERANVRRNTLTASQPIQPAKITLSTVNASIARVRFSKDDLQAMGVSEDDLAPFIFKSKHADALADETLGNTALERRPLVRVEDHIIVALPTAIGATIRRFVIERATEAGELKLLRSAIAKEQVLGLYALGCTNWGIKLNNPPSLIGPEGLTDSVGTFDDGSYVHLIFVCDDLAAAAQHGLLTVQYLYDVIGDLANIRALSLAAKPDYRRGLTIVVHGGIGRGFATGFGKPPPGWQFLCLTFPDFLLLASAPEFTALRAWKLLEQEDALRKKGFFISNMGGFLNLTAFAYRQDFKLVSNSMNAGVIQLDTSFIAPFRHQLRDSLDHHGTISPDRKSWVEVQRKDPNDLYSKSQRLPIYFSPRHMAAGQPLACVKTGTHACWVHCDELPNEKVRLRLVIDIWEMAVNWLARLTPLIEKELRDFPSSPLTYRLCFPSIESFTDDFALGREPISSPLISVCKGEVVISCPPSYLRCFVNPSNCGDRMMITALIRGAQMIWGAEIRDEISVERLVQEVVRSDNARFVHLYPARTPVEAIQAKIPMPEPRFLQLEDYFWSHLGLAWESGWKSKPGTIPKHESLKILNRAVDAIWKRIKARLLTLERVSVIRRAVQNFETIQKDRSDWHLTAAAQLALRGNDSEVVKFANRRDRQRDIAGLASRVIAEMAVCTCPYRVGAVCTLTDLDILIAEVAALLDCANWSSALYYGLTEHHPSVYDNGSFDIDASIQKELTEFSETHRERTFKEAADDYGVAFITDSGERKLNNSFDAAFTSEFGLNIRHYTGFLQQLAGEALAQRTLFLLLSRSEVLQRLKEADARDPERAFQAFSLVPRAKWDEYQPTDASRRDWYPWCFNRRLSILRRPLVQLSNEKDPDVLVTPSLLERTLHFLCEADSGSLPVSLFDSNAMKSWIGRAADQNGHAFAGKVAAQLNKLQWNVLKEVSLTRLGGSGELGDIDVLAWRPKTGLVYAIECKRLMFDRTIEEIGKRLNEYAPANETGEKTPVQRHLDRLEFLRFNPHRLVELTRISLDDLKLRSALVTERLVPMQFSKRTMRMFDLVIDYAMLNESFK